MFSGIFFRIKVLHPRGRPLLRPSEKTQTWYYTYVQISNTRYLVFHNLCFKFRFARFIHHIAFFKLFFFRFSLSLNISLRLFPMRFRC